MPTDNLPEPYATIARLRALKTPESEIAAAVNLTPKIMWARISRWNYKHPDRRVPKPHTFRGESITQRVIDLSREGVAPLEICARTGIPKTSVYRALHRARANGRLPRPSESDEGKTALHTWTRLEVGTPTIRKGRMSDILRQLEPAHVDRLLARAPRGKPIRLANLLADLVREHV